MTDNEPKPPRRGMKFFFRIPVFLARMGFAGWERLLGLEWMLLMPTGRKSGKKRYAMVDVLLHEKESDTYIIEVGFGRRSDWYRNIQAAPRFEAQVGRRRFHAAAEELPPEKAAEALLSFVRRRPAYARAVLKMVGVESTSEAALQGMAEKATLLAIHPQT